MSSENPHIETVELKILEIDETQTGITNSVAVELKQGSVVGTVTPVGGLPITIYYGDMTYKSSPIDMVQANFDGSLGAEGQSGSVVLEVNLMGDNRFINPGITTSPLQCSFEPLPYLKMELVSPSKVRITFIEPAKGEFVAYPVLYFHTMEGIIDPGVTIHRKPD